MNNSNEKQVSIVLPVYNEEKAIAKVIDDITKAMEQTNYSYEVLIVDDKSTDRSVAIAKTKDVRIVKRSSNGGSGASRKTGILKAKGEIIVMLDADGTYDASDIPKMLSHFPKYDQVNGARTSEKGTLKFLRLPAKWLIRKLACYLTGVKIPDLNTGLKAFKKDVMMKYLWVIPNGFSCVTSMTLSFITNGHAVKYIPTKYYKRIGKSKFHPIKDTLLYVQAVLRMITYFNPLKVFIPVSLFLFSLGLAILFYSYFFTPKIMDITIIILIISSFQVLALGMIADLIVKSKNNENSSN